jgi:hypothetical protein
MTTRKFQQDGFTVTVSRLRDEDPDVSYLAQDYSDHTATERGELIRRDVDRLASFAAGEWFMVGIAVGIRKQTSSNWADGGPEVGRASIWGIESDSDESYLVSTEAEMVTEAFEEVKRLREVL